MCDFSPGPLQANEGPVTPADLRRLDLFKEVPEQTLAKVFPQLEQLRPRGRTSLVASTALRGQVAFAWSGRYRLIVVAPNGPSVTLKSVGAGDMFGQTRAILGYEAGAGLRLITEAPGLLLHMDGSALLSIALECGVLGRALFQSLAALALDYSSRVYELAALDVRARVIAELSRLALQAHRVDGALVLSNAPTQAAIGAQVGAAREAVTRCLRDLTQGGVIRFKRGVIVFTDLDRLRELDLAATGRPFFDPKGAKQ